MAGLNSLLTPILNTALGWMARARLPQTRDELHLDGLHTPVEVLRDHLGVPHIYAQDSHDLFFAQGFVHAQDRLWQMEFNRRLVAGRLSEILGALTVPVDRWMRTLTMRRVAEHEVSLLNDEAHGVLQAYADGINAFIASGKLPIEFTLLRYKPEPWIIADSLAWVKMMSWSLSVNWEAEILRARFVDCLGPDLAAELEPPRLERWPTIVPPGSDYSYIGKSALERAMAARPFTGPSPYEGLGSNNWVVSGALTATGKPLLANDMHLPIAIPAIWYENHLIASDLNLTGVIFPGLPGIIAGHNGHVAWGFTNGFPDVQDLYIERLRRTDDGRFQVEYNGDWKDARILRETIQVKGSQPVIEEVVITRHGPVINSLAPDFAGEQPLALRWTSLEPDTMVQGLFDMFRGASYAAALNQAGIVSVMDLLQRGATRKGRAELVEATGIHAGLLLKWINHADLFRIKGVGKQFGELLEAAGVDTVMELAQRNPANLFSKLAEVNAEKKLAGRSPHQDEVNNWVQQAKGLPRVVEY